MRNKRLLQIVVIIVLGLFLVSTIGLSLISITTTNVQAPTKEDTLKELNDQTTGQTESGILMTGTDYTGMTQ